MKRNFLTLLCTVFMLGAVCNLNAQKFYSQSVGGMVGNMWGGSYQLYLTDNIVLGADLGVKLVYTAGQEVNGIDLMTLELNPNVMYSVNFTPELNGLFGGGISLGYNFLAWNFNRVDMGKFGINALAGIEYKLDAPLVLQADIRPGFGMLFGAGGGKPWPYFDWAACVTLRYILD
ncbi:MAG: hypothetical protein IJT51_02600 [Bacteroidales bacterium]|nr:hypothetical protein [Bacteroidales bacterium]